MLKFDVQKKEAKKPSKPPYWYKDVKELLWFLIGTALVIWMSTKM